MTPQELVQDYFKRQYRLVFWPAIGDKKGPWEEGWTQKHYQPGDYHEGYRVGILTGTPIGEGRFVHDVDIDWAPGSHIALRILPATEFVFGRASKIVSHCFYALNEPLPSIRYEDVDRTCLLEFRGTKSNGEIGFQTMVPPSNWSKGNAREPLTFVNYGTPTYIPDTSYLMRRVLMAAISILLAKHLGHNGFGHEARLYVAGHLLRLNFTVEELVVMGEAISIYCNNKEVHDVRRTVESTAANLEKKDQKKVKGGPSLARLIGQHGKAVLQQIQQWLGRDEDFIRTESGTIAKDNQHNIRRAIQILGKDLSYNAFADKMLVDGVPLEDREMNDMWLRMDEEFRFRPTYMFFEKVIHRMAWDNEFHPVKDYLTTLTWDGVPRLDTWIIDCAGAEDSPFLRAISSLVLIAAVRRIQHPGAKFDELLVLEGAQGLNKSSALRALCPKNEWFSDDLPLNTTSQKVIEATLGKWIIEAADLAGKRKAEIEQLKATLSRQIDGPARLAYARLPVERPRQFVIIGTTNSAAYLTDPTGARRFWPVSIQSFDVVKILKIRDQLWAEAAVREAKGESIRLREELWPEAAQHQEKRREIDPWEPLIRNLMLNVTPTTGGRRRIATNDLWEGLGVPIERRDRYGAIRISEIMQRLGFKRTTVRTTEGVQTGYITDRFGLLELKTSEHHHEDLMDEDPGLGVEDRPF